MKKISVFLLVLMLVLACSDKGTDPEPKDPLLSFSPETSTLANVSQSEVSLILSDLPTEIFAISIQIIFDPSILSFAENNAFTAGDFFSQSAIEFIKVVDNK